MRDRTALITGASRGIGRAIALELAAQGARVAVNYRSSAGPAQAVVQEIERAGGRALPVEADIGDPAQIRKLMEHVNNSFGPVDILVNNAGVLYSAELDSFDGKQMESMRRINVDGLINLTRAVTPSMIDRRFGRIVNLASIAAHGTTLPGNTFYAATKAAVITLTRRFAMELGQHGITVNAVAPGFIMTDMASQGRSEEDREAMMDKLASITMVRRVGQPEDVARAVSFFASDSASFITAQVLTVDGGRMDYIAHP